MVFTKEEYDNILSIEDSDRAFDDLMDHFNVYTSEFRKYMINTSSLDIDIFKTSTRLIFLALKHIMVSENIEDEDFDEETKNKYYEMMSNIDIITNSMNAVEINKLEDNVIIAIQKVFEQFEFLEKDIEDLNNTFKDGCDMLDNSIKKLDEQVKLSEIIKKIKSDEITDEYLIESKKWCNEQIKSYDKEDVMKVIKDYSDNVDYKKIIKEAIDKNDKDNLKYYTKMICLNTLITTTLTLESKLGSESLLRSVIGSCVDNISKK